MELFGYSIFRRVGPSYIVGLFCAATSNAVVHMTSNRDLRTLLKGFIITKAATQFAVITCDGLILLMFLKSKQLYRSTAHRLMLLMAITDILHALTTLPYTIYMTIFCVTFPINLNPYFMMVSSIPLTIQLKIKLTLTAAVALQRALALYSPIYYRNVSSAWYAITSLLLGILLACTDLLLEFALSPFKESPNCGSVGCFVSEQFLYYWGTSNMASSIV
ncbi:unnamed protein product [Cylicostephanus goldi]|uniref:G-protein coupled receptors family 1 profile domain-containing protein n=1 Tax=Cylicostephanus goldi TaxID=71465 RepID=A0A3P6QFK6_CYLGO|nr:unnamed protein product [Cylicostephanus goldi]